MLPEIIPVTAPEYAAAEDAFAALLGTERDLLLLQGEAALPLEAAARGLARPGARALNIVTSPYGATFGDWLRSGGAEAHDLHVPFNRAVTVAGVEEQLERLGDIDIVSLVHAEAASGALNPLREIADLARRAGALVVVDAVASLGADELLIDDWDLDLVVLSAQKALGGPTGVSAVAVSQRAWQALEDNPLAPRRSLLSLLDWRDRWLLTGRQTLPVIPHHVELRLFRDTIEDALANGGLEASVARHAAAGGLCERGVSEMQLTPWLEPETPRSNVATVVSLPAGLPVRRVVEAVARRSTIVGPAPAAPDEALRISHTGARATQADVEDALAALAAVIEGPTSALV